MINTKYPKPALQVLAYKKGINGKTKDAMSKLLECADTALSTTSKETFPLEVIANVTDKELEDVMKTALSLCIPLSKNEEGKYYVTGSDLISLTDTELFCGKEAGKSEVKKETKVKKEDPETPKEDAMEESTKTTEPAVSSRKRDDKPKTGKALLKSILSGGSSMDIQRARKFLIDKKIKSPIEVALMSDPEVMKYATKDCVILSIENEAGKCEIAIPKDELKKIDISRVLIL